MSTTIPPKINAGWSKCWPDDASMQNEDEKGVAHYPGWSMAVLKLLYEDRHIAASGHETTDTDPGVATTKDDYSLESYVLGTNHHQEKITMPVKNEPTTTATGGVEHYV